MFINISVASSLTSKSKNHLTLASSAAKKEEFYIGWTAVNICFFILRDYITCITCLMQELNFLKLSTHPTVMKSCFIMYKYKILNNNPLSHGVSIWVIWILHKTIINFQKEISYSAVYWSEWSNIKLYFVKCAYKRNVWYRPKQW